MERLSVPRRPAPLEKGICLVVGGGGGSTSSLSQPVLVAVNAIIAGLAAVNAAVGILAALNAVVAGLAAVGTAVGAAVRSRLARLARTRPGTPRPSASTTSRHIHLAGEGKETI